MAEDQIPPEPQLETESNQPEQAIIPSFDSVTQGALVTADEEREQSDMYLSGATPAKEPAQTDTVMGEAAQPTTPAQPSPMPKRTATPVNGAVEAPPIPSRAAIHGAPARAYLNTKVTGVLLEGMKMLAKEQ
ncbi:MAG: hypothetical protein Q9195_008574 [Heterodermia aff. obscurata]